VREAREFARLYLGKGQTEHANYTAHLSVQQQRGGMLSAEVEEVAFLHVITRSKEKSDDAVS
jgi:hypothetical protein